jgi:PPM family protein phosphatase
MGTPHDTNSTTIVATSAAPGQQAWVSALIEVDLAGQSHRGKRRPTNEDHFLIARIDRTWRKVASNLPFDAIPESVTETAYGLLVADGMGGHAAGEVASRTAITTFVELILQTPDLILRPDPVMTEEALRRLELRFRRIKETLAEQVRMNPSLSGMGTTMTLACTIGVELLIAHVGDSRAYLFRDGGLQRLTRDQTMAQFLADSGVFRQDEIAAHPLCHALTSTLGTGDSPMDVDLRGLRIADGDRVLLCSDGLTGMVSDEAIAAILRRASSAAAACEQLLDAALEQGGTDNITVVLGHYRIVPAPV